MVPPDHTLRRMRELCTTIRREGSNALGSLAARELADLLLDFDNTLCLGIGLPRDWQLSAENHVKTYASIAHKA